MYNISNLSYLMKTQPFDKSELVNHRFVAHKEHLYSNLNGEAVILSLKNGKYYGINAIGTFIWSMIQNPISFQDIQTTVMQKYNVDEATCRQEVLSFLEKMAEEDLIEIVDEKNS